MQEFKHALECESISEFVDVKRNGSSKTYTRAQRLIYTEAIRKLHAKFLSLRENVHCSFSSFFKYKPFYITPPKEREKESCLCMKCQNAHLFLIGINNYGGLKNLMKHSSVTQFTKNDPKRDLENFSERDDAKEINYHVFETKVESFTKNDKTKEYSRAARVEIKDKICDIAEKLLQKSGIYLRHRSHVNNISEVFPLIRETFTGKYIELDFSGKLAFEDGHICSKTKFLSRERSLFWKTVYPHLCTSRTWRK